MPACMPACMHAWQLHNRFRCGTKVRVGYKEQKTNNSGAEKSVETPRKGQSTHYLHLTLFCAQGWMI